MSRTIARILTASFRGCRGPRWSHTPSSWGISRRVEEPPHVGGKWRPAMKEAASPGSEGARRSQERTSSERQGPRSPEWQWPPAPLSAADTTRPSPRLLISRNPSFHVTPSKAQSGSGSAVASRGRCSASEQCGCCQVRSPRSRRTCSPEHASGSPYSPSPLKSRNNRTPDGQPCPQRETEHLVDSRVRRGRALAPGIPAPPPGTPRPGLAGVEPSWAEP